MSVTAFVRPALVPVSSLVAHVEGSKNLDALLTKVGINHKTTFSPGGHTWANWRIYLNDFAPHLFK